MREMKDSRIEWIGEVPNDWRIVRNKNAFVCNKELVGEKSELTQLLSLTTRGIKKKDINNAEGKLPESFDTYQFVKENDIVMCLFDLDCSAVFSGISPFDGMISPAYRVLSCKESMEPRYADYWFRYISDGRKFNHYAKNIRYTLSYEEFSALPLLLPEKSEQRSIADYLDRKCSQIDAIIARQQEVIEKLKTYKLSVITEAVTKGLNPNVPMKDSGVEWIGEIPEHWEMLKLKYASSILRGKFNHRPRNDPAYYDGIYPFVQTGDVARANKYIKKYSKTLNEKGYAVSKVFPANSICMTIAANIGDVAILTFDACFPDSVVGFVQSKNITWNYLYYVLTAMKQQFVRNAIISTQLNLNIEIIKEEFIPVAPLHIQEQISEFLDNKCLSIDRTISAKQFVIDKLADYKKSLIYEVVTGKKEV